MEKKQKVVLITGASSGIGLETANFLSKKGYKVYSVSRREYLNDKFTNYICDINNTAQFKEILDKIYKIEGRLDLLVNNAGMGISGSIENTSKDKIEMIFQTNLISLVKISSISIEYLRKTKGRIINIGSVAGVIPLPFQACYSSTKSAVENFSSALDMEVRNFGMRVLCVRPGDTKTNFTNNRVKNEQENDAFYSNRVKKSISKMERDEQKGMKPISVSKLIYKMATRKNPPPVATVGFSNKLICVLAKFLPKRLVNYIIKGIYG